MKTNLTARNLELTDRLRAEIERKLHRLDRIAHPDAEASVELIAKASHASESSHVAEITLVSNRSVMRSTSAGPTPIAAFNTVIDKLERQVVRAKKRPRSVRERAAGEPLDALVRAGEGTAAAGDDTGAGGDTRTRIVKLKRFDLVPMFEEDAIARMEELGHAFFVFLNAESDDIAVIYRRRDGAYGVIEPILARRGKRR